MRSNNAWSSEVLVNVMVDFFNDLWFTTLLKRLWQNTVWEVGHYYAIKSPHTLMEKPKEKWIIKIIVPPSNFHPKSQQLHASGVQAACDVDDWQAHCDWSDADVGDVGSV